MHLRTCSECRGALAALEGIRAEVRDHGEALFSAHPSADDLTSFALAPAELAEGARASIERHVRACPTCEREASLARAAGASAWQRALPARLAPKGEGPARGWLRAAPAVAALLLVYPAYLGWVELPRQREQAEREMAALRSERAVPPGAPWSGAAKALVLSGPTRGDQALLAVRPEPGQPYLPLVLAIDPEGLLAAGTLTVAIRRADGTPAWSDEVAPATLWDARNRVASLLVPLSALPPGEYAVELHPRGAPALFTARFRVEGETP